MNVLTFKLDPRQHDGCHLGAATKCHEVYRLGNILVSVSSSGRSHQGSITFRFRHALGQACTAAEWVSQHSEAWLTANVQSEAVGQAPNFQGAPAIHSSVYHGPGIEIQLSTYGRTHQSSFIVSPVQHPAQLTAPSLTSCGRCRTVDVLQAEQPADAAVEVQPRLTAQQQQCVAAM